MQIWHLISYVLPSCLLFIICIFPIRILVIIGGWLLVFHLVNKHATTHYCLFTELSRTFPFIWCSFTMPSYTKVNRFAPACHSVSLLLLQHNFQKRHTFSGHGKLPGLWNQVQGLYCQIPWNIKQVGETEVDAAVHQLLNIYKSIF